MELRDYWRVFKRRWWIPILLAVAAVVTVSTMSYFSKPAYSAAATVFAKGSNNSNNGAPVVSFPQAATSNSVALGVIQKLRLNESVDHLIGRLRVTFMGSNLYRLTVTDANPDAATAIANEVARQATVLYMQLSTKTSNVAVDEGLAAARDDLRKQLEAASLARLRFSLQHPNVATSKDVTVIFQALQLQLEEDSAAQAYRGVLDQIARDRLVRITAATGFDARVIDQAVAAPDSSGRPVQLISVAVLALVLGTMLAFLLEYLDTTVREPDAAEEMVGAPVIGVIPRASPQSLRAIKGGV
jgi:capsular polysaccharide biosynthesis protein